MPRSEGLPKWYVNGNLKSITLAVLHSRTRSLTQHLKQGLPLRRQYLYL